MDGFGPAGGRRPMCREQMDGGSRCDSQIYLFIHRYLLFLFFFKLRFGWFFIPCHFFSLSRAAVAAVAGVTGAAVPNQLE